MPIATNFHSDISKNTHCLPQNANPHRGEAAVALTCFSNVNLESRMTPKIFNSDTLSTTEPSITKSGNKGSTVREREISIPLVLLRFTNISHLQHQSLITAKSSFNDAATDDLS